MLFEWDEDKRQEVLHRRRVDILYAALMFEGPVVTARDDRRDYGEERFVSIGLVADECFVIVYTRRGDRLRLITAWKGGRSDRRNYEERIAPRDR